MKISHLTLADKITFLRILLIPLFLVLLLAKNLEPFGPYLAALVFAAAALTDTVDGFVARIQKKITAFGQFLDPLADKLLITAALVALVNINLLALWVALTIIFREFLVSALRTYAVAKGKTIPASFLGKLKTVSQILAIIVLIINPSFFVLGKPIGWMLMVLALCLTIFSGGEFLIWYFPSLRSSRGVHSNTLLKD